VSISEHLKCSFQLTIVVYEGDIQKMKEKAVDNWVWVILVLVLIGAGLMGFTMPPFQYVGAGIFLILLLYPLYKIVGKLIFARGETTIPGSIESSRLVQPDVPSDSSLSVDSGTINKILQSLKTLNECTDHILVDLDKVTSDVEMLREEFSRSEARHSDLEKKSSETPPVERPGRDVAHQPMKKPSNTPLGDKPPRNLKNLEEGVIV
jgi:hypothetical protein